MPKRSRNLTPTLANVNCFCLGGVNKPGLHVQPVIPNSRLPEQYCLRIRSSQLSIPPPCSPASDISPTASPPPSQPPPLPVAKEWRARGYIWQQSGAK